MNQFYRQQPQPRKHRIIRFALLIAIGALSYFLFQGIFPETTPSAQPPAVVGDEVNQENVFVIEKGEGVGVIAVHLEEREFISSAFWFKAYVLMKGLQGKVLAGTYILEKDWNLGKIVNVLSTGPLSNERVVTFLEGWTAKEMNEHVKTEEITTDESFITLVNNPGEIIQKYEFLEGVTQLEGFLFPDTYRIFKDAAVEDVIVRMLDEFDSRLTTEMRAEIKNQNREVYDVVIMASILEREVRTLEDRKKVTDLILRRIDAGIPLQMDSTVNYVTGKDTPAISLDDTRLNSPYNTYKYGGLPPGPISNPSIESLTAAIYPEDNPYWYFLNAKDGTTIFSKDFEEHKLNKSKYLR
ncbi:MAG: endolytic transglycosylase MltG [Candidatus Jacksonbacteria bacterium]|jgi:UPF0755 protein|nr:endolytic transglycosylase MltG [Candidatus Jacksonbacteria bacterium]MBT6034511.1 endolytic transglycosylase MltG [Candidatus Jacksonbacteria bacterium]MBT6301302.1 endolytic transglycosylase MltG [Candidatus Jacksonbacteria bacterium]MBT6756844.1 endolytic transglycosylase MltG [Candidatus Jacksonbacteria bacterium]MBT6955018.1 endolytic transglycosylase MltG [Candidatus Jacksonbacteria bacterium]